MRRRQAVLNPLTTNLEPSTLSLNAQDSAKEKGKKPQPVEEEKKPETKEAWADAGDVVDEVVGEALG